MEIRVDLEKINQVVASRKRNVIARRMGISYDSLRQKLKGENALSVRDLNALAYALEIPIESFVSIQ